jgi:transcriptional regulator with XRE-family HTH domain
MTAPTTQQLCNAVGPDKQVARLAGVHPATAARWRRGETSMPAAALLRLVARSQPARATLLALLKLDDAAVAERLATIETELAALKARRTGHQENTPHALAPCIAAGVDHHAPGPGPGNHHRQAAGLCQAAPAPRAPGVAA